MIEVTYLPRVDGADPLGKRAYVGIQWRRPSLDYGALIASTRKPRLGQSFRATTPRVAGLVVQVKSMRRQLQHKRDANYKGWAKAWTNSSPS